MAFVEGYRQAEDDDHTEVSIIPTGDEKKKKKKKKEDTAWANANCCSPRSRTPIAASSPRTRRSSREGSTPRS